MFYSVYLQTKIDQEFDENPLIENWGKERKRYYERKKLRNNLRANYTNLEHAFLPTVWVIAYSHSIV